MTIQQLDLLIDEAAKVAAQLGDDALLDQCRKMVQPAQTYQAANYAQHDPLGAIRKAWNDYADALRQSLNQLGVVFTGTITDIRNVRDAIVDLLRQIDAKESARLQSVTLDSKATPGSSTGGAIGDMQQQAAHISEQLQQFKHLAQVVPLVNRVIEIDHDIKAITKEYVNPRRRLSVALFRIRVIRAMSLGLRSALSAAIYVVVFYIGFRFDDEVKDFVAGLLAGQAINYIKLFSAMLIIEVVKGKLVDWLVGRRLRRWEASATGKEMESLSGLAVKTYILIAKMKAELRKRSAAATP